jgi:hypothetical protein
MKAADVTQHSLDVPKAALAAENPLLVTWKLQSLVHEASATGQRSSPFGDRPQGYLNYSRDGRMYAIGVTDDRPKTREAVPTDEEKVKLQGSMFAYAVTYTADGEKVVHHVDISWNQSWTGTDPVRFYELDGSTLTITTARAQSAFDDPAPGTEDNVREYVEAAWSALTKIGLAPGASTSRLRFESDLREAVADKDLVQENAPEREPLKIKLFADIDSILPPPAILASSTSGIPWRTRWYSSLL